MIVYTACNLLNFLLAPFSLKEPLNLLVYYKLDSWKSENMKIRRLPDRSASCQIKIRPGPDRSGCCLIKIRQLPHWSGRCWIKIRQPHVPSGSHHGKIRQLPDWSGSCQIEIRQLPDQLGPRFVRSISLSLFLLVWIFCCFWFSQNGMMTFRTMFNHNIV